MTEKTGECKRLDDTLTMEKKMKEQVEEQRATLLKQYEEEKANWNDTRQTIEEKFQRQQSGIRERIPFDPFGEAPLIVLNAVKSDCKTRDK